MYKDPCPLCQFKTTQKTIPAPALLGVRWGLCSYHVSRQQLHLSMGFLHSHMSMLRSLPRKHAASQAPLKNLCPSKPHLRQRIRDILVKSEAEKEDREYLPPNVRKVLTAVSDTSNTWSFKVNYHHNPNCYSKLDNWQKTSGRMALLWPWRKGRTYTSRNKKENFYVSSWFMQFNLTGISQVNRQQKRISKEEFV